jgi:hypothetical protein
VVSVLDHHLLPVDPELARELVVEEAAVSLIRRRDSCWGNNDQLVSGKLRCEDTQGSISIFLFNVRS